jgi:uncharacterized delta-60 repeat protein
MFKSLLNRFTNSFTTSPATRRSTLGNNAHRRRELPRRRKQMGRVLRAEQLEGRSLMAAGVLDTSLNGTGVVESSGPTIYWDNPHAVGVFSNNKVVLGGVSWNTGLTGQPRHALLAKYNEDGSTDTTFGTAGKVELSFGANDGGTPINTINDIAIDHAQRIVAVGYTVSTSPNQQLSFVARFDANGILDSTFGTNGVVYVDTAGTNGNANSVEIDSQNRIVVGGVDFSSGWYSWVTRLSTTGANDWTHVMANGDARPVLVTTGPQDKVVLTTFHKGNTSESSYPVVARITAGGSWDTTFGGTGIVAGDVGDLYSGIAVDNFGRVIVTGKTPFNANTGGSDVRVARLTNVGVFDSTFDGDGRVTAVFSGHGGWGGGIGSEVAIGTDGKITIAGNASDGGTNHPGLLRFSSNGAPDLSMGDGGGWLLPTTHQMSAMAIDSQSRIILAGKKAGEGFAFSRYLHANVAPNLSGIGANGSYTENAAPVLVASTAEIADPDNIKFKRGRLTLRVTSGASSGDRLTIQNQGAGVGQIGVVANEVRYEGWTIGTYSGGNGSGSLVVNLTTNFATVPAIRALMRAITFRTLGDNPAVNDRQVTFTMTDGNLGTSNTATVTMSVVAVNDRPVLGAIGSAINYTENALPIPVTSTGTVFDVDSPNFDGGKLTARISVGAKVEDRLSIQNAGPISVVGDQVHYDGVSIGEFVGGNGVTPLVINLNSTADSAKTQSLLNNIVYANVSDNPYTTPRTFWVQLNDGDGSVSPPLTKTIQVTAVNDGPVLGGIGGSASYAQNSAGIYVSNSATVLDVDSTNFDMGKLTVEISAGADASNRLEIGGTIFTIDGSNNIIRAGQVIGTLTSNGVGLTKLEITFNANATAGIVQQLVRAIRFKTVAGTSIVQRNLAFALTDGDGGTSATLNKTVDVT